MSLLFLFLLAALAGLLQYLSIRHCLDKLTYDVSVDKQLVECDEEFKMTTSISNGKRLPVLFLKIIEKIPSELIPKLEGTNITKIEHKLPGGVDTAFLEEAVYIMPRQTLTRSVTAAFPTRGRFVLYGATLTAGDLLGLSEQSAPFHTFKDIVVMPKRADISDVSTAFGNYLGDISVKRFILSDPILTVGFREYTGREPQKDIFWPRTLRDGRMMVKQYDYTSEMTASVLLNIYGGTEDEIEDCYSITRSVCEELENKRINYSFSSNSATASTAGMWSHISDGIGPTHFYSIMEGLGRATYDCVRSFSRLMLSAAKRNERSRGYILITPSLSADDMAIIRRFEAMTGQKVFIISASSAKEASA